jgi:MFS family permease
MRLFRSSVFSISVVLAFIVGFAMLGALTFLPTYLQYVKGVSATTSGLQTLPLVVGLLVTSIFSGVVVGRTGRYKAFPVAGSFIMAIGLFLLSRLNAATPFWSMALGMLVLGIGIGLCMQVLTIIVQNIVDYRDLGVATSGVTFFRTLGSSFGAAVFGTIYANVLSHRLPPAIAASPGVDPKVVSTPAELHQYPEAKIAPIVDAYAHAIHVVFLAAVPVAGIAFVLALFLKEVPLRGTSRAAVSDVGDGFGMPEAPDSEQCLQGAIARLFRRKGREVLPIIRRDSATTLDIADGWCVGQVHLRTRVRGSANLEAIGRRVHVPAPVLQPAFQTARQHGYLTGGDSELYLTEVGQREIDKLVGAIRRWLAEELTDWGAGDDELLTRALDNMANQFIDEDPELLPAGEVPVAIGGRRASS